MKNIITMRKIRAVIIEDEPKAKVMLKALLEKYCLDVHVIGDASNVKDGVALIKSLLPDLVFLDIEMPEERVINLFKYFDKIDFEVIFTTAYDQYAIEALRLSALDYLLKPVDVDELIAAVEQFKDKQSKELLYQTFYQQMSAPVQSNTPKRLALRSKESFTFLDIPDIMYCIAEGS